MESFGEVVDNVKSHIKDDISDVAYNCWITFLQPVKFEDGKAILYVKTPFQKDIIIKQYFDKIVSSFNDILGFPVEVLIVSEEDVSQYMDNVSVTMSIEEERQIIEEQKKLPNIIIPELDDNGTYEYTFDTFIVGSSNNFAYAACKAVSTQQTGSYNPLFIYGPSGLGKTHLLTAIRNEISRVSPEKNIVSIPSELFTNELIAAITNKTIDNFHNKYRKADVLLMDDVQFIAGKESTQEEFFHTFNELYQVGKQIVLTSDRPPKDIKTLEDRLKSRFEWGLLTDISPPDFETRIAIINRKADLLQIQISPDVCEFVANRLKTNIRQLEGAVKKIKAYKLMLNSPPSIAVAQTVIKEILNDNQPVVVTVERIIDEVAKTYSVTSEDIRSTKRSANISTARQASMFIVREITQMALAQIGEEFGGRDHSTVVYAIKEIEKKMQTDARQKAIIEDIIKNIRNK